MTHGYSGGKRQREANRDRKKREKQERLRRNRDLRARGIDPNASDVPESPMDLPEVKLEDIVLGVPRRPKRASIGPTKLFVGGLSWTTSSEGLRSAFARFGPIVEATVVPDRENPGRSRGFGFVTFQDPHDADTAMKQMSGAELDGRTLKVSPAEAR